MLQSKELANHIMPFLAVAETRSFTKAAKNLDMSISLVSKRITDLETLLKCTLFTRSTRSISLTQSGQILYNYAHMVRENLTEAVNAIQKNTKRPTGQLKLVTNFGFGHHFLSPFIAEFIKKHPDVQVETIFEGQSFDLIETGADLIIRAFTRFSGGLLPDAGYIAKKIYTDTLILCASQSYIDQLRRNNIKLNLKSINFISINPHKHFNLEKEDNTINYIKNNKEYSIKVNSCYKANNFHAVKDAVLLGIGAALVPHYIIHDAIKNGSVTALFKNYTFPNYDVYAIYPKNRNSSLIQHLFLDELSNYLALHRSAKHVQSS